MNLSRRAAQPQDEDFLFALHKAAMQGSIASTWGEWDEAGQREQFRQTYQPEALQVIQLDGVDIGVVHVQERTEEFFLANIEILPAYQRRGIGTLVIRQIIEAASQRGKPVALRVLKVNLAARNLYQRLGFGVTGENATHYIMAYETH